MSLPLYKDHDAPKEFKIDYNTGLWYNKFCNKWDNDYKKIDKDKWLETVTGDTGAAGLSVGKAELISEMNWRFSNLIEGLNGKIGIFKNQWRFVTGLGIEHPVENGFAWHHTLGTPYLPGSSVKGLVRSWATNWADITEEEKPDTINRIFGPEGTGKKNAGSVIFFDALPANTVKLDKEVMTPHYSEYYRNNEAPADWLKPVPIVFLTVAPEQTFVFAVAPRHPENSSESDDVNLPNDVEIVMKWLQEALAWCGAGAKTATGYGRFIPDRKAAEAWIIKRKQHQSKEQQADKEKTEKQREKARQLSFASMSPIRQEMEQDGYSDNQEKFMTSLSQKWLNKMDEANIPSENRLEIASLLAQWYQLYKPEQWQKPNPKNTAKIARIKSVLEKQ